MPSLVYLFGVSFLTTLDIYKTYFKNRHSWRQRQKDLFSLCEATTFVLCESAFFVALRSKDPGPNSYSLVNWALIHCS